MLDSVLGLAFWGAVLLVANLLSQRAFRRATSDGFVARLSPAGFLALLLLGLLAIAAIVLALSAPV